MDISLLRRLLQGSVTLTAILLTACGGGGGPSGSQPPPSGLSYTASQHIVVGTAVNLAPTVTGQVSAYSISPALGNGLSLNATTGAITGTPTATIPATSFTVTATNASGSDNATITIQILDAPPASLTYNTTQWAQIVVGVSYDDSPTVTGVATTYSISPALPPGLILNSSTGELSGKPTTLTAVATYTVTASNDGGNTSTSFPIAVRDTSVSVQIPPNSASVLAVTADSVYGISKVSLSLDNTNLGSLTAGNFCASICSPPVSQYGFNFSPSSFVSGNHTVTVTTSTDTGVVETYTQTIVINNPPAVSVTPRDGAVVYGSLTVTGTATSDKPGSVTTVVSLNNTAILTTTLSPFSVSYNLSGVASGYATLLVTSTDSQGTATTVSGALLVTTSQAEAGLVPITPGNIIAADGSTYLYELSDGVHLSTGITDVVLQGFDIQNNSLGHWHISNGLPYADGSTNTSPNSPQSTIMDVYTWSSNGAITDLCTVVSDTAQYHTLISVHDGWAYWESGIHQSLELFNIASHAGTNIASLNTISNGNMTGDGDFYPAAGKLQLYYSQQTDANDSNATQVYHWDQASNTATQITSNATGGYGVQTDGNWVAWLTPQAVTSANHIYGLTVYNPSTATTAALPATLDSAFDLTYSLSDGLLAWVEQNAQGKAIKAWNGATATTTTISADPNGSLLAVSGGYVIYADSFGLHAWSPSGTSLLVEVPAAVIMSGKTLYFHLGGNGTSGGSQGYWYSEVLP
jgi:Putative Ig domain